MFAEEQGTREGIVFNDMNSYSFLCMQRFLNVNLELCNCRKKKFYFNLCEHLCEQRESLRQIKRKFVLKENVL